MTRLCGDALDETTIVAHGERLMRTLVAHDGWLPEALAQPHPEFYRQYLLHADPLGRFSLVSFVWGPGQSTPIHDHTVWGMVGVMRGAEICEEYTAGAGKLEKTGAHRVNPGDVDLVSPTLGDIHLVSNADPARVSVSIHCYGSNIGAVRRHVFAPGTGTATAFISGYSSPLTPNLWDRSTESA